MTWILPHNTPMSRTLVYAPDTKVSDLDLERFSQLCEKSLSWRGKHTPQPTWLRRLKRVNWLQHLCGRMCEPSRIATFTALWTSFLRGSRASHSPFQANFNPLKTHATSSLTSCAASENVGQQLSFWKTWKEYFPPRREKANPFSSMSLEDWKKWATAQREEYSVRTKWERPTCEDEYLLWPTPTSRDWKDGTAESCLNVPTNCLLGREVHKHGQAASLSRSEIGKDKGRLNPDWVEQLQGLPRVGWTDLSCWGTESLRTQPPKRSSPSPND